MAQHNIHQRFIRTLAVLLLALSVHSPAWADIQKFIYVFDGNGSMLSPLNAAERCPDLKDSSSTDACRGVKVATDGSYDIELSSDTITSPDQLVLVAKTYEHASSSDTYVETKSKRRLEKVKLNQKNKGVDINLLSEAGVKAVEKHYDIQLGKTDGNALADTAPEFDPEILNKALANEKTDNEIDEDSDNVELGTRSANLGDLSEEHENTLLDLADLVLDHHKNEAALGVIRKNVNQGLLNSDVFDESAERILGRVAEIATANSETPLLILDADRYVAHVDELINLNTNNSINANQFFGYT